MTAETQGRGWLPIESAPYNEVVEIHVGVGMTFRAILRPDASMSSVDQSCDQWQAAIEGEHPPCWSDGCGWETNEDDLTSLQPNAWRSVGVRLGSPDLYEAVRQCRDQFAFYADEHRKSGKIEKAETNERYRDLCATALAKAETGR